VRCLNSNGAKETRTPDPLHAMQVRYQLRYSPVPSFTVSRSARSCQDYAMDLGRVLLSQRATHRGLCTGPMGIWLFRFGCDLGASVWHPGAPRPGPAPRVCADTPLDPAAKGFAPGPHWGRRVPKPLLSGTLRLNERALLVPFFRLGWCHFASRCCAKSPSI
jgi:hypothetical protein